MVKNNYKKKKKKKNKQKWLSVLLQALDIIQYNESFERFNILRRVVSDEIIPFAEAVFIDSPIIIDGEPCLLVNFSEFIDENYFELIIGKTRCFHTLNRLLSFGCRQYLIDAAKTNNLVGLLKLLE